MRREINFKGRRLDNGDWVYGCLLEYSNGDCSIYPRGNAKRGVAGHAVDPKTVSQFTGLQDRDNKDIYENDKICWVCKQGYHTYDKGEHCVVRYFSNGQYTGFGFTKDKPLTQKKAKELLVLRD